MNHGNCRELLGSLSEYLDGELEGEICAKIESHMAGCERCRIVINSLRKTVELYHESAAETSMPEEVRLRLFKRLDLDDLINK